MNSPITGLKTPPPAQESPKPVVARPPAKKSGGSPWRWIAGLLVLGGLGYFGWTQYQKSQENQRLAAARNIIPTATAGQGTVEQVIRLTGTTSAEKFVSLVAPQMRSSRSGRGRNASGTGAASQSGTTGLASARAGASVASTGAAVTSAPGGGGAGGGQATAGFTAPNSASAMRSATSRVNTGRSSGGSTSASSSAATQAASEALGADGLGSTGSSLGQGLGGGGGAGGGGGGGGGGAMGGRPGGDFAMVLQELATPGSNVKKGQKVAEFDRQNMLLRVEDYRSSVAQQEANFKKMQAQLKMYREAHRQTIQTAKAALDKARLDMKTIPVLSEIDAERVKLALEEAEAQYKEILGEVRHVEASEKAQLRNAELDLKAAQLELRRSEQIADLMISTAAIDGMVVMQSMLRGSEFAQIGEGDQLFPGQLFMQIVDTSTMVVNASMNQVDAERLRVGQKATVSFDAYPGLSLKAHVQAVGAVTKTGGFRANFVKEIPVVLKLDQMDSRVIPDLSVSVDVVLGTEEAKASAPLAAIFRDGGPGSRPFVYVREGAAWRRQDIEIGLENYTVAAIRSGLKPGDVVALARPVKET